VKVLQVEIFGRGGLTHYVYNLSRALAEKGVEVTVATAADYELDERTASLPPGVHIEKVMSRLGWRLRGRLPYRLLRFLKGLEFIWDAVAVRRLADRFQPDIVHIHCTNAIIIWLMGIVRGGHRNMVFTAHDIVPPEKQPIHRPIYRWIYRLAGRIIVHSELDRRRLQREFAVEPDRMCVVPHGDYSFFETPRTTWDGDAARQALGISPDAEVALFFGFIREYKGLDSLMDVWPEVAAERPKAKLVVAGDPARLSSVRFQEFRRQAISLGAVHHFRYIPFDDVPKYFAAADILALPYREISQSGVLLLAMSVGLPVVATRVGAFPEVIEDGTSGILVTPNSPSELRDAIVRALEDPELRRRLAEGAQSRVLNAYSWEQVAKHTIGLFEELCGSESRRVNA